MTKQDKLIELARYDSRAQSQLINAELKADIFGSQGLPLYLQSPYIFYEEKISELIRPNHAVLELGAGSGLHTWALVNTGAEVTASDISPNSLKLLDQRMRCAGKHVKIQVADIESLPFGDATFDVVACAGSLSYGDSTLVDAEIKRVLRPGGLFLCVDSLNNNPIYRFNRWLHYRRGERTKSTLRRMPDIVRIGSLSQGFSFTSVHYFGALSFVMPIMVRIFGEKKSALFSNYFDQVMKIKRSGFKFVLIARGYDESLS